MQVRYGSVADVVQFSSALPPTEQRAIAHILGTLDDKIELNRRMNATLEEMARALFKSWFVDFDPVRAKMEGRDTGLPREIADLFPDAFEESAVGEVPKGWKVGTIGDVAEVLRRQYASSEGPEYWDGDIQCSRRDRSGVRLIKAAVTDAIPKDYLREARCDIIVGVARVELTFCASWA